MPLNWPLLKQDTAFNNQTEQERVRSVQYLLCHHGNSVKVDGIFGPKTVEAVKKFQRSKSLKQDGVVGDQTWAALVVTVKRGDRGEAVKAVQSQFEARTGSGDPLPDFLDGIYGPQTEEVVRNFEEVVGLGVDGIVGAATWNALVTEVLAEAG